LPIRKTANDDELALSVIAGIGDGYVYAVLGGEVFEVLDEMGKEGVSYVGDDDAEEVAAPGVQDRALL
jgi:hypothetical protein